MVSLHFQFLLLCIGSTGAKPAKTGQKSLHHWDKNSTIKNSEMDFISLDWTDYCPWQELEKGIKTVFKNPWCQMTRSGFLGRIILPKKVQKQFTRRQGAWGYGQSDENWTPKILLKSGRVGGIPDSASSPFNWLRVTFLPSQKIEHQWICSTWMGDGTDLAFIQFKWAYPSDGFSPFLSADSIFFLLPDRVLKIKSLFLMENTNMTLCLKLVVPNDYQ